MDLKLKDKVYIVSGGSEGIGAAITQTLVEEGAKVLILTKAVEATHQMENTLNEKELRVVAEIGTLPDVALCQKAVESALNNFGRLDGVVNNAGVNDSAGLEAGPEAFRSSVELNLFHFYDLVYCALPQLKQNRGSIINIASKVALTGQGGTSGYAAAKGAILGLTREWAVELLPFAIRVNAILPAEVMTPLYRKWLKQFEHPEKMAGY